MMSLEDFQKARAKIEKMQRDRDEAAGSFKTILKQIKDEFKCKSLKEAHDLYEKMIEEEEELRDKLEEKEAEFRKKWKDVLG